MFVRLVGTRQLNNSQQGKQGGRGNGGHKNNKKDQYRKVPTMSSTDAEDVNYNYNQSEWFPLPQDMKDRVKSLQQKQGETNGQQNTGTMPSQYQGISRQSGAQATQPVAQPAPSVPASDASTLTAPTLRSIMRSQLQPVTNPPQQATTYATQTAQLAQGTTLYDSSGNPVGRFVSGLTTCRLGHNKTCLTHTNALIDSGADTGLLGAAF